MSDIPRTGWKDRGIPSPESLAEHMYSTWLMAFLMLPDTYSGAPDYNKQSIMKLLLIHDMGERTTGDIPRPQKNLDREKYDRIEDYAMSSLLLKGTYPQMGENGPGIRPMERVGTERFEHQCPDCKGHRYRASGISAVLLYAEV